MINRTSKVKRNFFFFSLNMIFLSLKSPEKKLKQKTESKNPKQPKEDKIKISSILSSFTPQKKPPSKMSFEV